MENMAIDVLDDESDWALLPRDILDSISKRMTQFVDYLQFGSVCKSWRRVAQEENHLHSLQKKKWHILKTCQNRLPLLLVGNAEDSSRRSFYSIKDKATYDFEFVQNNSFYSRRCLGSSHGWLFTIDKNMVVTLVNPFTDGIIHLPQFKDPSNEYQCWVEDEQYDYFIRKGILSSDPVLNPHCYEVIVIYGHMRELAFYKCGDETWTFMNVMPASAFRDFGFHDIQCYQGHAFAINFCSELLSIDLASYTVKIIIAKPMSRFCGMVYLLKLEGGGDLIMVKRSVIVETLSKGKEKTRTIDFMLFKLVTDCNDGASWVQIKSLGNYALFLGDNCSLTVSTLDFPCCEPNSIYYTDHFFRQNSIYYTNNFCRPYVSDGDDDDTAMFNLTDSSFMSHYLRGSSTKHLLPAIWIVPNFK